MNTSNMEEKIMGVLVDCFSRGVAVDKTVASIAEEFKSSIYAARRLVITELSRIQCQSLLDDFVAHNIEKYKIIGADDDKTCEVCQHMIGKIFYVKDAIPGQNLPPLHPNGRCSIAPVFKGVNDNV